MNNLKSIEYFVAVAEYGTLTKAAHHLHVTQPALSKQIKLFENELGYKLFERSHQGMKLTDKGRNLYEDISPLLLALKNKMKEHSVIKNIRFGVSPFLATYYLPELEAEQKIKIDFTVTREECREFLPMLESGKIDAAIVQEYASYPGLFSKFLYEEEFQAVVPKGHPLTEKTSIHIKDCLNYPQVLPPEDSQLYRNIQLFIKEKNIDPVKIVCMPYHTIIDYVMKGYGITYLPALMIEHLSYKNLQFIQLENKELIRKLYLFANSRHVFDIVWQQLQKEHSL